LAAKLPTGFFYNKRINVMGKTKRWIVTTSGNKPLADIKKHLTEAGFSVEQVLSEIGCITGTASDDIAGKLRKIPGVSDVSPDTSAGIGLPGDSTVW